MDSVLGKSQWGRDAVSLLKRFKELDSNEPVILNIRHTERYAISPERDSGVTSTPDGIAAAREYASYLPKGWNYRIWHTSSPRTLETAKAIDSVLRGRGLESEVMGVVSTPFIHDSDKFVQLRNQFQVFSDTDESARKLFMDWKENRYPSEVMASLEEFGKGIARELLDGIVKGCVHILISHDVWVAGLMNSWIGEYPEKWVTFLDGFIVQLQEESLRTVRFNASGRSEYPEWWTQ